MKLSVIALELGKPIEYTIYSSEFKSCVIAVSESNKLHITFFITCETWVDVNIGNVRFYKRNYNEHNLYWQKNFKPNNYAFHHRELRILGQKTAYFTAEIIKKFNPELWCIENGSSSLIFKYLAKYHNLNGNQNKTYYSSYDNINFSQKPTTFYSNKKISLRKNIVKSDKRITGNAKYNEKTIKDFFRTKSYSERSAVPIQLYHHILAIYEGKGQLSLFN